MKHLDDKCDRQSVLLVDDEEHFLNISKLLLNSNGIRNVITTSKSLEVLPILAANPVSVIVLDLHMPEMSGVELLQKIVSGYPHIPVILVTANDEIETVVTCMKRGAFDYIVKPINANNMVTSIRKALELQVMTDELSSLKERLLSDNLEHAAVFEKIVTANKKMRAIFQYTEVVAATHQPILITGETGVGKELFARCIHEISSCRGEFVAVNVAGLDDNMFSDTMFGHKKGAFTGAEQAREGMVASAVGGTLFLDEIGDLDCSSQIKLLRLLQEKEYYPVGSDFVKKSDARVVMSTNRDLQKLVAEGKFRNDLYFRLCAHQIHVPPLRERTDDIPILIDYFLEKAATSLSKKKPTPPAELAVLLSIYNFPGNVRELEGMVIDAVIRHSSGILSMDSFKAVIGDVRPTSSASPAAPDGGEDPLTTMFGHFPTIDEVEDYMIGQAMKMAKGNQGIAANLLGMGRQTLNKRLKAAKEE